MTETRLAAATASTALALVAAADASLRDLDDARRAARDAFVASAHVLECPDRIAWNGDDAFVYSTAISTALRLRSAAATTTAWTRCDGTSSGWAIRSVHGTPRTRTRRTRTVSKGTCCWSTENWTRTWIPRRLSRWWTPSSRPTSASSSCTFQASATTSAATTSAEGSSTSSAAPSGNRASHPMIPPQTILPSSS